ncbi:hypothetical protein JCM1840_000664 [Sporobolomyces johnsonii]
MRSTSVLCTLFLLLPAAFAFPTPDGSGYASILDSASKGQTVPDRFGPLRAKPEAVPAFNRFEQEDVDDDLEVVNEDETTEKLEVTQKEDNHVEVDNVQVEVLKYNVTMVAESASSWEELEFEAVDSEEKDGDGLWSVFDRDANDTLEQETDGSLLDEGETLDKDVSFEDVQFEDMEVNATSFSVGDFEIQVSEDVIEEEELEEDD